MGVTWPQYVMRFSPSGKKNGNMRHYGFSGGHKLTSNQTETKHLDLVQQTTAFQAGNVNVSFWLKVSKQNVLILRNWNVWNFPFCKFHPKKERKESKYHFPWNKFLFSSSFTGNTLMVQVNCIVAAVFSAVFHTAVCFYWQEMLAYIFIITSFISETTYNVV